jgi:undecaprenyl-diphosphatase
MSYLDAILLGIIQGLTEFLPVSSSGHLVLAEHFLNAKMPGVAFELAVHFGTLLSVLIYFRKRIISLIRSLFVSTMQEERKMVLYLFMGTLPAAIAGVLFKDYFEAAFSSPFMISIFLMITGLILLLTAMIKTADRNINIFRSIIIGLGQAIAILPGISRSGSTISTGLFLGVKPSEAAEFSFLLSIPAIIGAIVFKINDLGAIGREYLGVFGIGVAFSFVFGLLAVYLLLNLIRKGKFKYFGIYCLLIGLLSLYHFS